jgi:hypothetical protein
MASRVRCVYQVTFMRRLRNAPERETEELPLELPGEDNSEAEHDDHDEDPAASAYGSSAGVIDDDAPYSRYLPVMTEQLMGFHISC